jgi:hypothetical protein
VPAAEYSRHKSADFSRKCLHDVYLSKSPVISVTH